MCGRSFMSSVLFYISILYMRGSRNFRQGGSGQSDKKALTTFFFFSPQLILQKSNGQFQRNLSFSRFQRGSNIFQGGSNFFQGGSNCLFPIETHITCDFPGRVRTPCPPLWIRTCYISQMQRIYSHILHISIILHRGTVLWQTCTTKKWLAHLYAIINLHARRSWKKDR